MAKRKPDPVENVRPIIVKKIIEEGHGGHHGGAWKVAYADFVTAMMAFFLLMWLLGATEEKDRKAIADYFAPTIVELKSGSAGSNGLFGGESIVGRDDYPNRAGQTGTQSITIPQDATGTADEAGNSAYATLSQEQKEAMKKVQQLAEREQFEKLKKQLEERLGGSEQLAKLMKNVRFTDTREGLRIDLVDEANFSMFALSTDKLVPKAADLLKEVAQVINGMPNPVIIRTFDLGGDKVPLEEGGPPEANPFLGRRAIRICLQHHELFKTQLRAILRASRHGQARLLLPMISSLDELRQAKQIIAEAKKELDERGQDYDRDIELGIMIEVPSAAMTADLLAAEVDFLSIGTNDLIQYTLAVDRGNQRVAHLFDAYHPAVLRLINQVVEAGHRQGIWVGMCGEMASDPLATMLLVGLDLDELSVSPMDLPRVKEIVRAITYEEARAVAAAVLELRSAAEIRSYLVTKLREKFPELMEGA